MKNKLNSIKVSIAANRDRYIEGLLFDVSPASHSISVALPSAKTDELINGAKVYLCFEAPGLERLSKILVEVGNERDSEGKRILDLEVINWHELHAYLPAGISTSFNRRSHFRVDLPEDNRPEVIVILQQDSQEIEATMLDISETGTKLSFRSDHAPDVGETMRTRFCLPNSPYQFDLVGVVVGQWEVPDARLCGIEFTHNALDEEQLFQAQQGTISQYVMERQRELLQEGAASGSRGKAVGGDFYTFTINQDDQIVTVDDNWLQFAELNGATELSRAAVIGKSIWNYFSGSTTLNLYRSLFERVRSEHLRIKLPFRCDSPGLLRHMELEIDAEPDGHLKLIGRLLRQENRDPSTDDLARLPEQGIVMCSLCKRVQASGKWVEPEIVARKYDIFGETEAIKIEQSVCETCQDFAAHCA